MNITIYYAETDFHEDSAITHAETKHETTIKTMYKDGWRLAHVSIIPDGAEIFRTHLIFEKE